MYGIREGINKRGAFGGGYGANDEWNLVPCTVDENSGPKCWKKVTIGKKKWLVYDSFTPEELKHMKDHDEKKWRNYNCWIRWNEYCESRGARCFFPNMKEKDQEIETICRETLAATAARLKLISFE